MDPLGLGGIYTLPTVRDEPNVKPSKNEGFFMNIIRLILGLPAEQSSRPMENSRPINERQVQQVQVVSQEQIVRNEKMKLANFSQILEKDLQWEYRQGSDQAFVSQPLNLEDAERISKEINMVLLTQETGIVFGKHIVQGARFENGPTTGQYIVSIPFNLVNSIKKEINVEQATQIIERTYLQIYTSSTAAADLIWENRAELYYSQVLNYFEANKNADAFNDKFPSQIKYASNGTEAAYVRNRRPDSGYVVILHRKLINKMKEILCEENKPKPKTSESSTLPVPFSVQAVPKPVIQAQSAADNCTQTKKEFFDCLVELDLSMDGIGQSNSHRRINTLNQQLKKVNTIYENLEPHQKAVADVIKNAVEEVKNADGLLTKENVDKVLEKLKVNSLFLDELKKAKDFCFPDVD